MQEKDDAEINDHELFDVGDVNVEYHRSKDQQRVTLLIKSARSISEMRLYLILGLELEKLERRLGISEESRGH